nr:hypothetical protein [Tanacetum cinerariifolium]
MNCPLVEAFTKTPLVVYRNLLREFWCTAIATNPNVPTDDSEVRPLKEYTIKFSVMNGKKPLTIDFKTFIEFTGLDYAKDAYVSHPSPKVLGENYSSTEEQLLIPKTQGGNVQPVDKGLPSTVSDEGTTKSTPFPEGPRGDKDTDFTRLRYRTLTENKGKTSSKVEPDHETLQLTTVADIQAYLLSKDELAQGSNEEEHKKAVVSYANLKDSIEGYYEENVDHMEQTDKVIDAAMNSLDKNSIARGDILNALNGVTKTLKSIQDAVKEDHVLKKKGLKSSVESLQATTLSQEKHLAEWAKQDTSDIKSMVTEIYQAFKGQSTPSSSVPQPTLAITARQANPESSQAPKRIDNEKRIATDDVETQVKLVLASRVELIKKVAEQARLLAITKLKVVKVVCEEAEKIGIDPERITSAKEGAKFKKAQDAELKVHNPFSFGAFGTTESDELREIIQKKKNVVVKDLMNSLSRRYERIKKILKELRIQSTLPAPILEQASS